MKLFDNVLAPVHPGHDFAQGPFRLGLAFDIEDAGAPQRWGDETRARTVAPLRDLIGVWLREDAHHAKALQLARQVCDTRKALASAEATVEGAGFAVERALLDGVDPAAVEAKVAAAKADMQALAARVQTLERLLAIEECASLDTLAEALRRKLAALLAEQIEGADEGRKRLEQAVADAYPEFSIANYGVLTLRDATVLPALLDEARAAASNALSSVQ